MTKLLAFTFLVVLYLSGVWLVETMSVPIPGALPGLFALLAGLMVLKSVPVALEQVSRFLLGHLAVFFIPATVAVALYWPQLEEHWLLLLSTLVVTTGLSLVVTAWVSKRVIKPAEEPEA